MAWCLLYDKYITLHAVYMGSLLNFKALDRRALSWTFTYTLTGIRSLLVRYKVFTRPHVVSRGAPCFSRGSNTSANTFCARFSETIMHMIRKDLKHTYWNADPQIHMNGGNSTLTAGLPSLSVQLQWLQVKNPSIKLPPFNIIFSSVFKSNDFKRNLKCGFHYV
jgi:hypothetical protein